MVAKTKAQLKRFGKSDLISYVQAVERDLDNCIARNVELKVLHDEIQKRLRKIMLRKSPAVREEGGDEQ